MAKKIMDNSLLNFPNLALEDGTIIQNFSRMNFVNIPSKWKDFKYYDEYRVEDGEKIELISLKLYEDTSYWDLIMIYNGVEDFFGFPVNYDVILERTNEVYNRWYEKFGNQADAMGINLDDRKNEILEEQKALNEKYRDIKYIKKSYLSEFLREMSELNNKGDS
jgi:response regulator RpfG family c-di-GMP phosphodiesterase